jgi:hypothetical protein
MWSWLKRFLFPTYSLHVRSSNRTVRYTFPLLAVTALFAGLAAVSTQSSSYISITTSQTNVVEDETFMIEVKVYAHTPVNAVDIVVDYPEEYMTVDGIDTGTSVITLWTEDPYARGGKVYLRGGVFQKGFLGEHTIARIRGKASESGIAHVTLDSASLIAGDGKGTEIQDAQVPENETRIYVSSADGKLEGVASIEIITDVDGDGKVDLADISAFMAAWFSKAKTFDFNGDGRMTFRDFSILLADSFFK